MQNWATPLIICFKKRDGKCIKDTDIPSDGTGTSLALAIIIIFARSKHFCPFMPSIYYLYILIITIIIIIIIIKIIIVIMIIIIIIAIKIIFARSKHFFQIQTFLSLHAPCKSTISVSRHFLPQKVNFSNVFIETYNVYP